MPKKSVAKKKTTKPASKVIKSMTGGVVADNIMVKGSWIQRNQYNDYRQYRQQIAQITTPQQFIAEAEKMQAQIAQAKQQPALLPTQTRKIQTAEDDVKDAIAEAQKDQPNPKTMSENLKSAAETLEGVGKAVEAAQGTGEKIDKVVRAIDWPRLVAGLGTLAGVGMKLFGG